MMHEQINVPETKMDICDDELTLYFSRARLSIAKCLSLPID